MRRCAWLAAALVGLGCAPALVVIDPIPGSLAPSSRPVATAEVATSPSSSGWTAVLTPPRPSLSARLPAGSLAACIVDLRAAPFGEPLSDADPYRHALVDELAGRTSPARQGYFDLIQQSPGSAYTPLLYLAFGELFALEASSDSTKWELAAQAYQEVLKYPPERNPVHTYTQLRLGESSLRLEHPDRALAHTKRVVEASSLSPCGPQIRSRALALAVEAYAEAGRPELAHAFFFGLTGPGPELEAQIIALSRRYAGSGKSAQACALAKNTASLRLREILLADCHP